MKTIFLHKRGVLVKSSD